MSGIIKTNYLYIQSKYRQSGTPYNYSIILPPNMLDSDPQYEIFKITLMDFEMYFSWYVVTTGFNTITFLNNATSASTVVTIPEGTYSYFNLARKITSLYPACTCSWLLDQNKFQFTFSQSHTMSFDGIYEILGFDYGATPSGTSITSQNVLVPLRYPDVVMNLSNITPVDSMVTLTNVGSGEMRPSNMLAIIPINASPFQLITYRPNNAGDRGLYSSDNSLNVLEVSFTNIDGVPLTYLPEHSFNLKIEVHNIQDEQKTQLLEDVSEMKGLLKDLFMMKALKR
jgi:hypothetical protein